MRNYLFLLTAFALSACVTADQYSTEAAKESVTATEGTAPVAVVEEETTVAAAPEAVEAAPQEEATAKDELDPFRRVCKRQKVTGTRISKTVCRTAQEWQQMKETSEEFTRNQQELSQTGRTTN